MIKIGSSIKRLRTKQQISLRSLARTADITPGFLSMVESNQRYPSLPVLRRISKGLSVPVEVLLWESVEVPAGLNGSDREICTAAKLIVRRFYEARNRKP